jgi:hypothetical protein
MRVDVTIEEIRNESTDGEFIRHGLRVTCARCEHVVVAGGTQPKSLRWALGTMNNRCPKREVNYYGPPRFDFGYYGDDDLTERIRQMCEAATGETLPPPPKRPTHPPYGLTSDSEWNDLPCHWET